MTGKTILLVEDNPKVMRNNKNLLQSQGAKVLTAANIAKAREHIETSRLDAAVIDIMLPDGSGFNLMKEIRSASRSEISTLPVLLLTAMGESEDIVNGLSSGADDYLAKPYDLKVLAARVEALLRRSSSPRTLPQNCVNIGQLRFDLFTNQAYVSNKDLELTQKEFTLLFLLAQNEGKTLSAQYLYETAWKLPFDETSLLKVHISNLKKKLSDKTVEIVIETSYGGGYSLYRALKTP
ncbi:MAG: response regulator transcription factor [Treponema sp.]|jgi:DNA-binding response OmpR family regulator|nr:response regulator transcription factor [Treponema sp.]